MNRVNLRSIALRSLIVSVLATALLGIVAVLTNRFDELTEKIVSTTLIISIASLATLTCAALIERRGANPVAHVGIVLSVLAGALFLIGMWGDVESRNFWRVTASTTVLGIVSAHVSLLWLPRLVRRFEWVQWAALAVMYALGGIVVWMIVGEPGEETVRRPLAVLGILAGALTILVPVLYKLGGPAGETVEAVAIRVTCPDCGAELEASTGETECSTCGCRLSIAVLRRGRRDDAPDAADPIGAH